MLNVFNVGIFQHNSKLFSVSMQFHSGLLTCEHEIETERLNDLSKVTVMNWARYGNSDSEHLKSDTDFDLL